MEFKVGDVVKFKASFLQNIGWYTDVPKDGVIVEIRDSGHPVVDWSDDYGDIAVHPKNLMLADKPDYSGM